MITKAKVLSGFAAKLPAFEKSYEFGPGLNVLFGPNGCGKTTMVGILGAYSGTQAGWSRFLDPPFGEAKDTRFPKRFKQISPGKCEANVHWDGTASFLMSPETGSPFGGAFDDSPDGLLKSDEIVGEIVGHPSSGQSRILRLRKLFEGAKNIPDITQLPESHKHVNDIWRKQMEDFAEYTGTLPRTGPPTLLLDEIDRSLSIPNQVALWTEILPKVARKFQVIVATHCEFALVHKEGVIEMEPGYIAECRKWIEKARLGD